MKEPGQRRHIIRTLAWSGMAVIVLARIAIIAWPVPLVTQEAWSSVLTYLVPLLMATAGATAVALNSQSAADRRFWGLMAAALALVLAEESHWLWYFAYVDFHGAPLDSPSRILFFFAALLYTAMVVSLTRRGDEPPSLRLRTLIDILCAVVIAHPLVYRFWTTPAFARFDNGSALAAQAALYPIFGVTMCAAILMVTVRGKASRWRTWERLAVSSNLVFGTTLIAFPLWYPSWLASEQLSRDWYGIVLGLGVYLMFVAAVYRLTGESDDGLGDPWPAPRMRGVMAAALPVVYTAAFPILFWAALASRNSNGLSAELVSAVVLGVLLASRSWLSALELARLRRRCVADPITGAFNANCFRERLDEMVESAVSAGYPFCLVLLEVDGYARLERLFGRDISRHVLREVAGLAQRVPPRGTSVFRIGSNEFVAVLPEKDAFDANLYAQTVCKRAVAEISPDTVNPMTLLAGVAAFPRHAMTGDELLACARSALSHVRTKTNSVVAVYDAEIHPNIAVDDEEARRRLRGLQSTVRALAAAVDARDSDTRHHSSNVASLATALARHLELPQATVELIDLAAQMHDVGKIAVPDDVLLKPERLTAEEREIVRDHCELGERILAPANLVEMLPLVRHHHERWDGAGYPDGLREHAIPIEARILAVCDTFETMATGRRYCAAKPVDEVLEEIEREAGRQFDPIIAAALVSMVRTQGLPVRGEFSPRTTVIHFEAATAES